MVREAKEVTHSSIYIPHDFLEEWKLFGKLVKIDTTLKESKYNKSKKSLAIQKLIIAYNNRYKERLLKPDKNETS